MQLCFRGFFHTYLYNNKKSQYKVARIRKTDGGFVTIIGRFPNLIADVEYELYGFLRNDPSYGERIRVDACITLPKQTIKGVSAYLASPLFPGVTFEMASVIAQKLGTDALAKILADPSCLRALGIEGLNYSRLYNDLLDITYYNQVMVDLSRYNVIGDVAVKLYRRYGHNTMNRIYDDPYKVLFEVESFTFKQALLIASTLKYEDADARAIKAALTYTLYTHIFKEGNLYLYRDELLTEAQTLLPDLVLEPVLDQAVLEGIIIQEDNTYALPWVYNAEASIANKLFKLMEQKITVTDDLASMVEQISLKKRINYSLMQKEAIIQSVKNPVVIVTGGPGTGKTTIIDAIITLYAQVHNLNINHKSILNEIALMAPTGRAAKRMEELLGLEAHTIHRHLGLDYEGGVRYDEHNRLPYQLVIIDESSMVDIFIARRLFNALRDDCHLVIVGDKDQLPSVGPGNFLGDLIKSKAILTIVLNRIHRQAKNSNIAKLAALVNEADVEGLEFESSEDLYYFSGDNKVIEDTIINQIAGALQHRKSLYEDIQVLVPINDGNFSVVGLNVMLQNRFNKYIGNRYLSMSNSKYDFYISDKVIQTVNDKERKVMNGEIGRVTNIDFNSSDKMFLTVKYENNEVLYYQEDLAELNLAYAITIHKSQGSEYPIVMLPLVSTYESMLSRQLVYTAITRAKDHLFIIGELGLLNEAAKRPTQRRKTKLFTRLVKHKGVSETPYNFMEEKQ